MQGSRRAAVPSSEKIKAKKAHDRRKLTYSPCLRANDDEELEVIPENKQSPQRQEANCLGNIALQLDCPVFLQQDHLLKASPSSSRSGGGDDRDGTRTRTSALSSEARSILRNNLLSDSGSAHGVSPNNYGTTRSLNMKTGAERGPLSPNESNVDQTIDVISPHERDKDRGLEHMSPNGGNKSKGCPIQKTKNPEKKELPHNSPTINVNDTSPLSNCFQSGEEIEGYEND